MFSAFYLDPTHGWIATHRLPLDSAIHYCKEYRKAHYECPVALVPDHADPMPYLRFAEGEARRRELLDDLEGKTLRLA